MLPYALLTIAVLLAVTQIVDERISRYLDKHPMD